MYISGVKTMNLILGYSADHLNSFIINLGLKCIAREHPIVLSKLNQLLQIF